MEDLYLSVTLAALQDRESGIKTFTKIKSKLTKKIRHCFFGSQVPECIRQFGVEDKNKALEIGSRLLDAGYVSLFDPRGDGRAQTTIQEGAIYYWSDVVVMERKLVEDNLGPALAYFVDHPYRKAVPGAASEESKGSGLLKKLRGLVDEYMPENEAGSAAPAGAKPLRSVSPNPGSAGVEQETAAPEEIIEEDTDEIKFSLSPDDPYPMVKAASLDKLIERLTYDAYIDMRFQSKFLNTYRSFTTSVALLEKLRERFRIRESVRGEIPAPDADSMTKRKLIQLRVLTVLSRWLTDHFEDWADLEDLRVLLFSFLEQDVQPSGMSLLGGQIRSLYLSKAEQHRAEQAAVPELPAGEQVVGPNSPVTVTFNFDEIPIPDLAQQITAYEFSLFAQIQRDEFLGLKWSKKGKEEKARNILRYIGHFNRVSNWAVREIVTKFQLKQRTATLQRLVQLAHKFREYNNFSGAMCILAALVSSPIRRLKATWAELPQEWQDKAADLEKLFSHTHSYKTYREILTKTLPPRIPYLGLYLTDLTFIEEANPDKVDGLINFQKHAMISKILEDVKRFQEVPYKGFNISPSTRQWVTSLTGFDNDEEAYQMSLKIEPRNAALTLEAMLVEEDRLRKLLRAAEIRISDLEAENSELKEQVAKLDVDLRFQIRKGTEGTGSGHVSIRTSGDAGTFVENPRRATRRYTNLVEAVRPTWAPHLKPPEAAAYLEKTELQFGTARNRETGSWRDREVRAAAEQALAAAIAASPGGPAPSVGPFTAAAAPSSAAPATTTSSNPRSGVHAPPSHGWVGSKARQPSLSSFSASTLSAAADAPIATSPTKRAEGSALTSSSSGEAAAPTSPIVPSLPPRGLDSPRATSPQHPSSPRRGLPLSPRTSALHQQSPLSAYLPPLPNMPPPPPPAAVPSPPPDERAIIAALGGEAEDASQQKFLASLASLEPGSRQLRPAGAKAAAELHPAVSPRGSGTPSPAPAFAVAAGPATAPLLSPALQGKKLPPVPKKPAAAPPVPP